MQLLHKRYAVIVCPILFRDAYSLKKCILIMIKWIK